MGEGCVTWAWGASEGSVAPTVAQDRAEDAQTALSPNRGPNPGSIDNRTPAVARREDEIDTSPVWLPVPVPYKIFLFLQFFSKVPWRCAAPWNFEIFGPAPFVKRCPLFA